MKLLGEFFPLRVDNMISAFSSKKTKWIMCVKVCLHERRKMWIGFDIQCGRFFEHVCLFWCGEKIQAAFTLWENHVNSIKKSKIQIWRKTFHYVWAEPLQLKWESENPRALIFALTKADFVLPWIFDLVSPSQCWNKGCGWKVEN